MDKVNSEVSIEMIYILYEIGTFCHYSLISSCNNMSWENEALRFSGLCRTTATASGRKIKQGIIGDSYCVKLKRIVSSNGSHMKQFATNLKIYLLVKILRYRKIRAIGLFIFIPLVVVMRSCYYPQYNLNWLINLSIFKMKAMQNFINVCFFIKTLRSVM